MISTPPKTWCWSPFSGQRLMHRLRSTINSPKMLCLRCQFNNFGQCAYSFFWQMSITFYYKINVYAQHWVYVYTDNFYLSPEVSTWHTSCTQKRVFCKIHCTYFKSRQRSSQLFAQIIGWVNGEGIFSSSKIFSSKLSSQSFAQQISRVNC